MQQKKAKYKPSEDAISELGKLTEIEQALTTLTVHYNELRDSVWKRLRQAYFLDEGKRYEYFTKSGLIEEV